MSSKRGTGAGVGVGMLRGRGIPFIEHEKGCGLLGLKFQTFKVSIFGFKIVRIIENKFSKFSSFEIHRFSDIMILNVLLFLGLF